MLYNITVHMSKENIGVRIAAITLFALGFLSACAPANSVSPISNPVVGTRPCSVDVGTSSMFGTARALNNSFQGSHTLVEDGTRATFQGIREDGSIQVVVGVWGGRQPEMTQILETFDPKCDVVAFGDGVLRNEVDDANRTVDQIVADKVDFDAAATVRYPHLKEMTIALAHQTNRDSATEKVVEPRRELVIRQLKDEIKKRFSHVTIWINSNQKGEITNNPSAKSSYQGMVNVWDSSEIATLKNGNETPLEDDGMHYKPWWLLQLNKVLEAFHKPAFMQATP